MPLMSWHPNGSNITFEILNNIFVNILEQSFEI